MASNKNLNITYTADAGQVKKTLGEMEGAHGKFGNAVNKASDGVKGHFGSMIQSVTGSMGPVGAALGGLSGSFGGAALAAGGMAVGIGAAMIKAARAFSDYAVDVRKVRDISGATAEDASRLLAVMDDLGISPEQGAKAMQKFSRSLDDGSPALDKWFSNAEQAQLKGKDLNETIPILGEKFRSLQSPVERNAFLMDNFGKSGETMRRMLQLGKGDFKAMADEAERLGLIMSDKDITAAEQYEFAIDDLQDSFLGLQIALGRDVIPMLTNLSNFLTEKAIPAIGKMKDAWDKTNFDKAATNMERTGTAAGKLSDEQDKAARAAAKLAKEIEAAAPKALEAWTKAGAEFDKRMDGFVVKFSDYAKGTEDVVTSNEKVVTSTKNMDAAHARHADALDRVQRATERVEQAQREYNAAHAEYDEDGTPQAERFAQARDRLAATTGELKDAENQLAASERDVASATEETTKVTETSVTKGKAATQALIEGMKDKTTSLETFVKGMKDIGVKVANVADRDISQAFLAKLAEMGPGANQLLAELNTMSEGKLRETVGIFGSNIQAAKAASDLQFDKYPANWSQKIQAANTAVYGKLDDLVKQFNSVPNKTADMTTGLAAQMQATIGEILAMQQAGMIALDPLAEDSLRTAAMMKDPQEKAEAIKRALDRIPGHYSATVDVQGNWRWNAPGPYGARYASPWHSGGIVMHDGGAVPRMHSGGLRPDERMAILQAGEFVMQRSAVKAIGTSTLDRLNSLAGGSTRLGGGTVVNNIVVQVEGSVISEGRLVEKLQGALLQGKARGRAIGLS